MRSKRIMPLVAIMLALSLFAAACSSTAETKSGEQEAATPQATSETATEEATQEPTPKTTPEPSEEPAKDLREETEKPEADSTEVVTYDGPKIENLNVYIPQSLGLSAPLMNFGKEGHLDAYVENTSTETWPTMQVLTGLWTRGDVDMAATPSFVASNLYNKGIDARLVASVIWGFLYVVGPEDAVEGDFSQLKGKKVALMRPGNMPDLAMQILLKEHGMTKDDVEFVPVPEPPMIVGMLAKGEVDWAVGMEHQMSLAMKKAKEAGINLKSVIDLQEEWGKAFGGTAGYPTLSVVMPGEVLDKYPGLSDAIVKELQATSKKVNDLDPATITALSEKHKLPEEFIKQVIPRLNIRVEPAAAIQDEYETFLSRLGTVNKKIYGGKLPDDDFYVGGKSK